MKISIYHPFLFLLEASCLLLTSLAYSATPPSKVQKITVTAQEISRWENISQFQKYLEQQLLITKNFSSASTFTLSLQANPVRHKLAMWNFLHHFSSEELQNFSSFPKKRELLIKLSRSRDTLEALLYSGPWENPKSTLDYLSSFYASDPVLFDSPLKTKIAVATALEFSRADTTTPEKAMAVYQFYSEKADKQTLDPGFPDLSPWAMRLICGASSTHGEYLTLDSLKWWHDNERGTAMDYLTKVYKTLPAFNSNFQDFARYGENKALSQKEQGTSQCGAFVYSYGAAIAMGLPAVVVQEPGCMSARFRVKGEWRYLGRYKDHNEKHLCKWNTWTDSKSFAFLLLAQEIYDANRENTLQANYANAAGLLMNSQGKEKEANDFFALSLVLQPLHYSLWLQHLSSYKGKNNIPEETRTRIRQTFQKKYPEVAKKLLEG